MREGARRRFTCSLSPCVSSSYLLPQSTSPQHPFPTRAVLFVPPATPPPHLTLGQFSVPSLSTGPNLTPPVIPSCSPPESLGLLLLEIRREWIRAKSITSQVPGNSEILQLFDQSQGLEPPRLAARPIAAWQPHREEGDGTASPLSRPSFGFRRLCLEPRAAGACQAAPRGPLFEPWVFGCWGKLLIGMLPAAPVHTCSPCLASKPCLQFSPGQTRG